jgi:hypothetical protein
MYNGGITSKEKKHTHKYYINDNGDGYTSKDCNPNNQKICHSHKIKNWELDKSQSDCYPNCNKAYRGMNIDGVEPHSHRVLESNTKDLARKIHSKKDDNTKDKKHISFLPELNNNHLSIHMDYDREWTAFQFEIETSTSNDSFTGDMLDVKNIRKDELLEQIPDFKLTGRKINDIHNNGNHIQSYIFVGFSLNNSNFHLNFLGGGNKIMATKVFTIPILNSTLNQINDLSYNYNVCIKDIVVSDQDGKSMVKNGVNVEGECTGLIF